MTTIASSHRWAPSLEALTSRFSPNGLKWSSGGVALVLHLALGVAALSLMHSETPVVVNRALNVTLFTPLEANPPVEPLTEAVTETPPVVEPVPLDPVEPAPTETTVEEPAPDAQTSPVPSGAPIESSSTAPSGPQQVLTADGGEAGWAPNEGSQVSERTAGALRGLLCAGGSEHTRAAAGCEPASQGEASAFAVYASAEEIAKIESAFGPVESLGYAGGSTVNLGSFALPGQVNTNQPHYVSGAHAAFGRLPVSDKTRDPGFGD